MVLPGHIAGGYLAANAILTFSPIAASLTTFSQSEIFALYLIGILAGEIPDIDLLWFYLENRFMSSPRRRGSSVEPQTSDFDNTLEPRLRGDDSKSHRDHITHAPFFWLVICALISLFGYIFASPFVIYAGLLILTGTWTHFIFDSIELGISWLWPFSHKKFALFNGSLPKLHPNNFETGPGPIQTQVQVQSQIGGFSYYWKFVRGEYLRSATFYAEVLVVLVALVVLMR